MVILDGPRVQHVMQGITRVRLVQDRVQHVMQGITRVRLVQARVQHVVQGIRLMVILDGPRVQHVMQGITRVRLVQDRVQHVPQGLTKIIQVHRDVKIVLQMESLLRVKQRVYVNKQYVIVEQSGNLRNVKLLMLEQ
jgi:hypothetical protein